MKEKDNAKPQAVSVSGMQPGGHYSPAIVAGGFVFVSGQVPRDANRAVIGDTIEAQTAATFDNLTRVLAAAGATLEDVVKTTIYLTDLSLFPRFDALYATYFPHHKPARTTVECGLRGVMIEIEAIAHVGA